MAIDQKVLDPIKQIDRALLDRFGPQGWWPTTPAPGKPPVYRPGQEGRTITDGEAFEIIVGSILTQNNTWSNAEKAILNLSGSHLLEAEALARMDCQELASVIVSARYYNQKSKRLIAIAQTIVKNGGIPAYRSIATPQLREILLSWTGVGKETADSILCYAFQRSVFVVDAYTRRLFQQQKLPGTSYEEIQQMVQNALPASAAVYGDLHARIVKLFTTGSDQTFELR